MLRFSVKLYLIALGIASTPTLSAATTPWRVETVVSTPWNGIGGNRSLAIGADHIPHIVYWGTNPSPTPGLNPQKSHKRSDGRGG
jgi:hypothetical protein